MLFIARNHNGKVIGIVSARDESSVKAYYQGKGLSYNTLTEFKIDEDRENEREGYITSILETQELDVYHIRYEYKDGTRLILVK